MIKGQFFDKGSVNALLQEGVLQERFFSKGLNSHLVVGAQFYVKEALVYDRESREWRYEADNATVMVSKEHQTAAITWAHHKTTKYCRKHQMPEFAARLRVEVVSIDHNESGWGGLLTFRVIP